MVPLYGKLRDLVERRGFSKSQQSRRLILSRSWDLGGLILSFSEQDARVLDVKT